MAYICGPQTITGLVNEQLSTMDVCDLCQRLPNMVSSVQGPGLSPILSIYLATMSALRWWNYTGCLSLTGYNTSHHWWCSSALTTWVTQCHWSVMIQDVGDSVQLPLLITMFRALEPNSETGRSRSPVWKRGTTYHNQSAQLTVSSKKSNFIFLTHVLFNVWIVYVYVYSCNALSARFFAVDRALNFYFMIMITVMSLVLWHRSSSRLTVVSPLIILLQVIHTLSFGRLGPAACSSVRTRRLIIQQELSQCWDQRPSELEWILRTQ